MAARPRTLPATLTPVMVGTAVAWHEGAFSAPVFLATLGAALLLQIGANYVNDVADFLRGADKARKGPTRVTQSGLLTPREVKLGAAVVFGLATLLGVYLVSVGGAAILAIGVLSIVAAIAYTAGPAPLAYHGLGEVFAFVFFGVVAAMGTTYLQTGAWSILALMASISIGCLVTNILIVNNLRDIDTDRAANKRTIATRIGARATRWEYAIFLCVAYAVSLAIVLSGRMSVWALLTWLTLPLAVGVARQVWNARETMQFNIALGRTAQLELWFGAALAVSLLV